MTIWKSWTVWIGLMVASPALATVDPDPDQIGVYFDLGAQTICHEAQPAVPFFTYVIITNPTEEVWGAHFRLWPMVPEEHEDLLFKLQGIWPGNCPPIIDPGVVTPYIDAHLGPCYEPLPSSPGGVIVLTIQYMLLAASRVPFYLQPYSDDETPYYFGPEEEIIPLTVSSGSYDQPVAWIDYWCGLPTEQTTFGRLKSLYR